MVTISLDNHVLFDASEVYICESALALSPGELMGLVQTAFKHQDDQILVDAYSGGRGPLHDYLKSINQSTIDFGGYLDLLWANELRSATKAAKTKFTQLRRSEYAALRPSLVLALIEAGQDFCCADCLSVDDITIDHIVPLSRGGEDNVDNLQFLCRPCNSSKSDRIEHGLD